MRLHIENIMAIGSADIDLDGITVIVGNNNTGKSTIGKVLFAMFNALSNLNAQTQIALVHECTWTLRKSLLRYPAFRPKCRAWAQQLVNDEETVDDLVDKLQKELAKANSSSRYSPDWEAMKKQLREILAISEDELQKQVVLEHFNDVLGEQITPLFSNHGVPSACLTIKRKKLGVTLGQKLPQIEIQLDLQNKSYYFDNPSLIDDLGDDAMDHMDSAQMQRIADSFRERGGIVEDILLRKKYENAEAEIAKLLDGKVFYDAENEIFKFKDNRYTDYINLRNLSQGVKSLAMLQIAFSRGAIKDRDVLILDEPEIHLHPAWQIKFAELIVILQKAFNLTVLLTSHSPDFVEAIRLFAKKYDTSDLLNGYVSELKEDNTATVTKILANNWDSMFAKFAKSVDVLIDLRHELENQSNE